MTAVAPLISTWECVAPMPTFKSVSSVQRLRRHSVENPNSPPLKSFCVWNVSATLIVVPAGATPAVPELVTESLMLSPSVRRLKR